MSLFHVLPEPPDIAERWRSLVVARSVSGKAAHDARIVALMLACDITTILTFNERDFRRYQQLTVINPAAG